MTVDVGISTFLPHLAPLSWAGSYSVVAWLAAASFIASYVRSFSGFGFALLAIPFFLLVLPPEKAIPLSISFDVIVGLALFPSILKSGVEWKSVRWLLLSAIPFVPLGLVFSQNVPMAALQLLIGVILFVSTLLLAKGFRTEKTPTTGMTLLTGAASGFLGGIAGMFGPPVILFFMSSPLGRTVSRASMMAFFLLSLFFALGLQINAAESWAWIYPLPFLLVFVLLGTYLGHKKFVSTNEQMFRRVVYGLLFVLSISLIIKAAL
ncbi:MAG TPA: hypothetical protein DCY07_01785 [Rhodospirillaceae bacterium]|nr:hypothetical protein [Rhodospirillaceae bacterium]